MLLCNFACSDGLTLKMCNKGGGREARVRRLEGKEENRVPELETRRRRQLSFCFVVCWHLCATAEATPSQEDTFLVSKTDLKRWIEQDLVIPKRDKGKGKESSEGEASGESPTIKAAPSSNIEELINSEASEKVEPRSPSPELGVMERNASKFSRDRNEEEDVEMALSVEHGVKDPEVIDSSELLCEHGAVDPVKAEKMKVISQVRASNQCPKLILINTLGS